MRLLSSLAGATLLAPGSWAVRRETQISRPAAAMTLKATWRVRLCRLGTPT
jgi:hypothetical protein